MESEASRRQALRLAVFGAAGLSMTGAASAAPELTVKTQGFPRQAWAHKDGRANLLPAGANRSARNAMDYLLIQEALSRYGVAHDEARIDILATLFTADAIVEVAKGSGTAFQVVKGHSAVIANFASVISQQKDQRRHCFSNILIETLTSNTASILAYGLVSVASDGIILGATVIYAADLRKDAKSKEWQFSRLFIGMDDYVTTPPVVTK